MAINIRAVNWTAPVPAKGKYYRTAPATAEHIAEWKLDKLYLKSKGLGIYKNHGVWSLYLWTDNEGFAGDIVPPKNVLAPLPTIETSVGSCSLLPPQVPHTACLVRALRAGNCAIDTGSTGVGKSPCALVTAWNLGLTPIIICPKSVIGSWENWAKKTGQTIHVINYEQVIRGNFPFVKRTGKDRPAYFKLEWCVRTPEKYLVIIDEGHKCKSMESYQSAILSSTKRAKIKTLVLSATLVESTLDMKALGYCLGLHSWSNWPDFIAANGCIKTKQTVKKRNFNPRTRKYWTSKFDIDVWRFVGGAKALAKLSKQIFPRFGSGLTIADMKDFFPKNFIIPHIADMDGKIAKIHKEMAVQLKELAAQRRRDASSENKSILTELMRMQQEIELLKLPTAIEMAKNAVAEGNSVAFIAQFTATIDAFKKATDSLEISGNIDDKQSEIDAFQADKNHMIAVQVQSGATGVSLHDEREGSRPRISILMPVFDTRLFKQALGRIYRANGRATVRQYVLLDQNSEIDSKLAKTIERKTENLAAFNGYGEGLDLSV
jgi:hypothetical protein